MRKDKTRDTVHIGGCTIVLADNQAARIQLILSRILDECKSQITLDIGHERIHVSDGEVRITSEGGLIGYVDKDNKRSFGLWRDDFTSVVKADGEAFWPQ